MVKDEDVYDDDDPPRLSGGGPLNEMPAESSSFHDFGKAGQYPCDMTHEDQRRWCVGPGAGEGASRRYIVYAYIGTTEDNAPRWQRVNRTFTGVMLNEDKKEVSDVRYLNGHRMANSSFDH